MNTTKRTNLAALLVVAGCGGVCHSESMMDRTIEQLLEESSFFAGGKIVQVEGTCEARQCSATYEMELDHVYKGIPRGTISFCSNRPLSLGENYTIFFQTGSVGTAKNGPRACPLVAMIDGVFTQGVTGRYYRYMSLDGLNREIERDGTIYETYMMLEPTFQEFLSACIPPKAS